MIYRFGDCLLDTQRHTLQRAGRPVRLRAKAFQVLCYLLEHRDHTVLKSELYAQVWPQAFISEATLESTLRAVRQAIGDSGRAQQLIQTVHGYGYRFIAAVDERPDLPAASDDKAPGMQPVAVAAHPEDESHVMPLPPTQESVVEPDSRESGDARGQAGGATPGARLPPGEWKQVTVLCAAPVPRSVGDTPQDADTRYRQLSRLYSLTQPVVQRYAGTLPPVLGDHILAVFGAPVAQEDHAQRAVLAPWHSNTGCGRRVWAAGPHRATPWRCASGWPRGRSPWAASATPPRGWRWWGRP
jgi:DNA-binding winged helix-turn-helix (wHTH) protein